MHDKANLRAEENVMDEEVDEVLASDGRDRRDQKGVGRPRGNGEGGGRQEKRRGGGGVRRDVRGREQQPQRHGEHEGRGLEAGDVTDPVDGLRVGGLGAGSETVEMGVQEDGGIVERVGEEEELVDRLVVEEHDDGVAGGHGGEGVGHHGVHATLVVGQVERLQHVHLLATHHFHREHQAVSQRHHVAGVVLVVSCSGRAHLASD